MPKNKRKADENVPIHVSCGLEGGKTYSRKIAAFHKLFSVRIGFLVAGVVGHSGQGRCIGAVQDANENEENFEICPRKQ